LVQEEVLVKAKGKAQGVAPVKAKGLVKEEAL